MDQRYDDGEALRRQVLGDPHVEASLGRATGFTRELQEYITRACWGDLWTRPALLLRERSLLNLGMLTALGRTHELKLHVSGALTNGLSVEEVKEALLQSVFYCGGPAALEAFRVAAEVLDEEGLSADGIEDHARGIVHQAAFTWAEHAPADVAVRLCSALDRLRPLLAGVRTLTYGPDLGLGPQTADFAVHGWFVDESAYRGYAGHPAHQAILQDLVLPNVTSRTIVQYAS